MSETPSTQALVQLIEQKNSILNRIHRLVNTQVESVNEQKIVELMPLLSAKQSLLDELHKVEHDLNPYRDDDPDERQWSSSEARARCADMAESNRQLLGAILAKEKECERELVEQRERTAKQLDETSSAAAAIKSYQQFKRPQRGSLDLSSEA